jgi:deoxyadenosine/deoxycytidine kinase
MSAKKEITKLPDFVKKQTEIINSLQKRVNQLNRDFEIEKNCKNQAYFFIVENEYFKEFAEYSKKNPIK